MVKQNKYRSFAKKLMPVVLAATMLFAAITLGACRESPYLIEAGFVGNGTHVIGEPPVHVGVRSRGIDFDIESVKLNFYFGHYRASETVIANTVAVALYFVHSGTEGGRIFWGRDGVEDFRDIGEGVYFIREICPIEFFTPTYEVTSRGWWSSRYTFSTSEQIVVPSSMFISRPNEWQGFWSHSFGFYVVPIAQSSEGYKLRQGGFTPSINYRLLEGGQVRITATQV